MLPEDRCVGGRAKDQRHAADHISKRQRKLKLPEKLRSVNVREQMVACDCRERADYLLADHTRERRKEELH
jgi:hypothetical protein